jgi:hypothetical protein
MSIWIEIEKLKGQTLQTLDQHKSFDIISVNEKAVVIVPHKSFKERPIPRQGIENAYTRLMETGELTRSDIMAEFSEFNPAYVAAILAELPGVRFTTKPISLRTK